MRTITCGALACFLATGLASAREIPPPPPLVDYSPAAYVGASYVAVCAPARTYVLSISAPNGAGPQLSAFSVRGTPVVAEELAQINGKLTKLKSFASLKVECLTGHDLISIDGWTAAATGGRLERVTLHLTDAGVTVD